MRWNDGEGFDDFRLDGISNVGIGVEGIWGDK